MIDRKGNYLIIYIFDSDLVWLIQLMIIKGLKSDKYKFFQYCDSNIGLFSNAPCKIITLNPLYIVFGISSLLLFW